MVPLTLTGEDGRGPTLKTMANRIIGAIPYSLGLRLKNPSEKDSEKEIVAFRQERETIDLALLAKHIKEHGTSRSTAARSPRAPSTVCCRTQWSASWSVCRAVTAYC